MAMLDPTDTPTAAAAAATVTGVVLPTLLTLEATEVALEELAVTACLT